MRWWLPIVTVALVGTAAGVGLYTFGYAKGYSYLSDDPAACGNCHIMDEHLAAWLKSSHAGAATCNDCHTPHDLLGTWTTKGANGFWHSFYFTTGDFPDPIRITPDNHRVVENACRDCHARLVDTMMAGAGLPPDEVHAVETAEGVECSRCHRHVGHWVR